MKGNAFNKKTIILIATIIAISIVGAIAISGKGEELIAMAGMGTGIETSFAFALFILHHVKNRFLLDIPNWMMVRLKLPSIQESILMVKKLL